MVKVTIPYNWQMEYVVDKVVDKLSKTEKRIFACIAFNPYASQSEIGNKLSLEKTTIQNAIVKFRKMDLITRVGSNKTGYWKVTDKQ